MAMADVNIPPTVKKSKGGLLGKILGGIAGAIAGAFTAGAGAGPVAAGVSALGSAAGGMGLGGTIGEAIDPSKMEAGQGVGRIESKMPEPSAPAPQQQGSLSRYALKDPDVQTKMIKDSINEVVSHPRLTLEKKKEYVDYGNTALSRIEEMRRLR